MDDFQQLLTSYAYNIIGSYEQAKDVVQDVMLEKFKNNQTIKNEKAYLVRSAINRAINARKKQKRILSGYPGTWLPEPIATEEADHNLNQKDILSYSLMVLLEKLDARQRAVFILKEAFDYDHDEIAQVLDISIENSRKILSRAKKELRNANPKAPVKTPAGYLDQYIDIIRTGDTKRLEQLLSDDILMVSDGGGKAAAALHPLGGKEAALLFLSGIYRKFYQDKPIKKGYVNHQPALFFYEGTQLVTCQVFELQDGMVHQVYFLRNPDKLASLKRTID
ncbi:MAG: sigma-70 family RNA polymerase sigma factor [Flavisolibacter sp.]